MPGVTKSTREVWASPTTETAEKKTSSPTGIPTVSRRDSPRRSVMRTSARDCDSSALTGAADGRRR